MVCTIVVSTALLRSHRGDALGIPLVAIGTFTFLYVVQPLELIHTDTTVLFLNDWQVTKALLVPALMLVFFMWGWLSSVRTKFRENACWDPRTMWMAGFASACVGLVLYLIYLERSGGVAQSFSQEHAHAMDPAHNTAYIYYGPWLMLSGSVMMFLGAPKSRNQKWKALAPYGFLALNLLSAILTGSRGPLFAVASTYFIGISIAQRKTVSLAHAVRWLVPVGIGVLVMVGYRSVLHLGPEATTQELPSPETAFENVAAPSEYDQEHNTASQEFLYHAAVLDTVDQTGKLDYGFQWVTFLVLNPIPKLLWTAKQYPQSPGITLADLNEHTSLSISGGAATGIVADLYLRFHLLSAFFLYALGRGVRRLFVAARTLSSPMATVGYVMLFAVSLNMFAQGFGAIFVPLGYSMVPVALFTLATRESRRKAELRHRELILRQVAALRGEQWSS
jgi:hypothetical protein